MPYSNDISALEVRKETGLQSRAKQKEVVNRLIREGHRFGFYQAVWLLERAFVGSTSDQSLTNFRTSKLRFQPHTALVFPATDIKRIRWDETTEAERINVVVTFLGLYGIASPLPVYFYEHIATEQEWTEPHRDFLDIFDHRLYHHFYRAWKKYQPTLQAQEMVIDKHAERFFCLAGLGEPDESRTELDWPMQLATFAGRLAMRTRNAESLRALLSAYFEGAFVRIQENLARWVELSERMELGNKGRRSMVIGETITLGRRIYDISGKFRVIMKQLTLRQFFGLLPDGEFEKLFRYLVDIYTPDGLSYDLHIEMNSAEFPRQYLGDYGNRLGIISMLGRPVEPTISRVIRYRN